MKSNLFLAALTLLVFNSKAQQHNYLIPYLIRMSKIQFGFLKTNGSINQKYGDIECISDEFFLFDFNVDCGRGGEIITILVKPNFTKPNSFDMIRQKGEIYYGKINPFDKKLAN